MLNFLSLSCFKCIIHFLIHEEKYFSVGVAQLAMYCQR